MWVIRQYEDLINGQLRKYWQVGYFLPAGLTEPLQRDNFYVHDVYDQRELAEHWCHYLNGGNAEI